VTSRESRARLIGGLSIVATIHFVVWFSLFRAAFSALDAGEAVDFIPGLALNVLGAPLMFILYIPPLAVSPSTRWWGDTATFVVALAMLNSLLWGSLVVWVLRLLQRRRNTRMDAV
jgi:hypothetical protein